MTSLCASNAAAQGKAFAYEDYQRYFTLGDYATRSQFYSSEGRLELTSISIDEMMGARMLVQSVDSLDVSPNYDAESDRPFYKIMSRSTERFVWDPAGRTWVSEYTVQDFETSETRVWESFNTETRIVDDDLSGGDLKQFYRRADLRAQRNPDQAEAIFRESVVGLWRWSCVWLERQAYEVECVAVHVPTGRAQDHAYRKLGQMS